MNIVPVEVRVAHDGGFAPDGSVDTRATFSHARRIGGDADLARRFGEGVGQTLSLSESSVDTLPLRVECRHSSSKPRDGDLAPDLAMFDRDARYGVKHHAHRHAHASPTNHVRRSRCHAVIGKMPPLGRSHPSRTRHLERSISHLHVTRTCIRTSAMPPRERRNQEGAKASDRQGERRTRRRVTLTT